MKKYIFVAACLVLGMLLVSAVAMAETDYSIKVTPGTGIKGTAHDLSKAGALSSGRQDDYGTADNNNMYLPGGNLDRICIWCHTPHFSLKPSEAPTAFNYLPLWNHQVMANTYVNYSNGTGEPTDTNHLSKAEELNKQPGSVSRLCLSCHDGSVAVNAYGRMPDGAGPGSAKSKGAGDRYIIDDYKIGVDLDLSNHHPIGFVYTDVESTDDEIQKTDGLMGTGPYTIGSLLWGDPAAATMECTTCHDVHNSKNTGEKFLWVSDQQSALCLSCHLKADVKKQ